MPIRSRRTAPAVAALLLTGPTGVGKTSVSLALSRALFGREGLIRIDLSEYQQAHDVSRLIGAPPGYKGYGEGGQLTEKIRRQPRSVVLFDEVEKAHPDVLRLLLRLLEDGRLTDAEGRSADFRHAVILLTSNLGSGQQGRAVGFGAKDARQQQAEEQARRILQPELAARLLRQEGLSSCFMLNQADTPEHEALARRLAEGLAGAVYMGSLQKGSGQCLC